MTEFINRLTDKKSQGYAAQVGEVFSSLPHLPKGLVSFFVKVAPIFALIGAVLSLFASPVLALVSMLSVFTFSSAIVLTTVVAAVISVASAIILFYAYQPLSKRQYKGWMLLFWADVLSLGQTLLSILLGHSTIFSLIGTAICFYVLYEMRSHYKAK